MREVISDNVQLKRLLESKNEVGHRKVRRGRMRTSDDFSNVSDNDVTDNDVSESDFDPEFLNVNTETTIGNLFHTPFKLKG